MPVHKKIIKELTLYTLEEMLADPKLKKNLLDANQETDEFINLSLEQDQEEVVLDLESKGFCNVKVNYDLSYCQGSGAYFTFEGVNVLKLMKKEKSIYHSAYPIRYLFKDWGRKLRQLDSYSDIKTIHNHWANHYCHENCVDIEFDDKSIDFTDLQKHQFESFQSDFTRLYKNLCYEVYNKMQKALDYYTSEEFLIEDLKAREDCSLFLESGQICPEEINGEASLLNTITGFIYSNNSYVVIDGKNQIFSYGKTQDPKDGDFLEVSKEEDQGLSKAVIFSTPNEANEFIVSYLIDNYEVVPVEQAFKKGE